MNVPWGHVRSQTKFGPIGSAVLTFKGYKRTDSTTDFKNIIHYGLVSP